MISDVLQKKQILDIHSLIFLVATIGISIAEKINLRNVPLCEKKWRQHSAAIFKFSRCLFYAQNFVALRFDFFFERVVAYVVV